MRVFIFIFLALNAHYFSAQQDVKKLNKLIHDWHKAASDAEFDSYFKCLTDDFIFWERHPVNAGQKRISRIFKTFFDRGKHGILMHLIVFGTSLKTEKQLGLMKILQHGCKDVEEAGFALKLEMYGQYLTTT